MQKQTHASITILGDVGRRPEPSEKVPDGYLRCVNPANLTVLGYVKDMGKTEVRSLQGHKW